MPCSPTATCAPPFAAAAASTCCRSRTIRPRCRPTSAPPWRRGRTFPPYQQQRQRDERQTAMTVDKGHGRFERRTLTSTTALNTYLDSPGVGQEFPLEPVLT